MATKREVLETEIALDDTNINTNQLSKGVLSNKILCYPNCSLPYSVEVLNVARIPYKTRSHEIKALKAVDIWELHTSLI